MADEIKKIVTKKVKGKTYAFKDKDIFDKQTVANQNKLLKINALGNGVDVAEAEENEVEYGFSDGTSKIYNEMVTEKIVSRVTFTSDNVFSVAALGEDAEGEPIPAPQWDGVMQFSVDGKNWSDWDGSEITAVLNTSTNKYCLYIRGKGNTVVSSSDGEDNTTPFTVNGTDVTVSGNVESLLDAEKVDNEEHPTMGDYAFAALFMGQSEVISELTFGAETLSVGCYSFALMGTKTSVAPALNAEVMEENCYERMLAGTQITSMPKLASTQLAPHCYQGLCAGCELLENISALPAEDMAEECYAEMLDGCLLIKFSETATAECVNQFRIPKEGTGVTADNFAREMFSGTSGTFAGDPSLDTVYYTNANIVE